MNLRDICTTLAEHVSQELQRPTTVYPGDPGPARSYPCIVIEPGDPYVEYHGTFGNTQSDISLTLALYVAGDLSSARVALDDYCSDSDGGSSVRAAVESATSTLHDGSAPLDGLTSSNVVVDRVRVQPEAEVDTAGTIVTVARFDVRVSARRGS